MAGKSDVIETQAPNAMDMMATAIASIASSVEALSARVESLGQRPYQAPAGINVTPSHDQLMAQGMRSLVSGEATAGVVTIDRWGRPYKFPIDTVVELIDEEILTNYRAAGQLGPDQPLYGVIENLMYWRKRAMCPKYKVNFGKGFGSDGVLETNLRSVA